jgi:hypothetical protein
MTITVPDYRPTDEERSEAYWITIGLLRDDSTNLDSGLLRNALERNHAQAPPRSTPRVMPGCRAKSEENRILDW